MLFEFWPFLLAPDDGSGNGGGSEDPAGGSDSEPADDANKGDGNGDPQNADGDPAQPGKGETVARAEYERIKRENKRMRDEIEARKKAEEEAKRKADEEQGKFKELYEKEQAERKKLEAAHAAALKRAKAEALLNKLSPVDTETAILALENFEGYTDTAPEELANLVEKFAEAKAFLFATDGDGDATPGTQRGQTKTKPEPKDVMAMSSDDFEKLVRQKKYGS